MNRNKLKFNKFITLQRGFDLPIDEMKDGNIPVLGSMGIIGYHNKEKVNPHGVVTGRSGTIGVIQYTDKPYWPHNTSLWVKDFKSNHPKFVYYKMQTLNLDRFNGGASVPTLNRNNLDNIKIQIPDIPIQEKIASILSTYDDLIDNNRRRIQLLEEAARLLFREWFVYFRFPGYEKVKMVDGVPKEWEKIYLGDAVDTQYGFTETATDEPIGPKFLRGTDINKTSFINWSTVPYCPIDEILHRKYQLRVGDIVIIRMADPGKVAIVERDIDAVFASYLIRLLPTDLRLTPYYLFYVLSDDTYQGFISVASTGSTRKTASAPLLVDFHLLLPTQTILWTFEDSVRPLCQQITILLIQNEKLRVARDLLLPRLMSGAIEV